MLLIFIILFIFTPKFSLILLTLFVLTKFIDYFITVLSVSIFSYNYLALSCASKSVFKFSSET